MTSAEMTVFPKAEGAAAPANCRSAGAALLAAGVKLREAATWCGRRALLDWWRSRVRTRISPTYAYTFAHAPPGPDRHRWEAFHSAEIPYVFGTLGSAPTRHYGAADRTLSRRMIAGWSRFIGGGAPWRELAGARPRVMRLDAKPRLKPLLPDAKDRLFNAAAAEPVLF